MVWINFPLSLFTKSDYVKLFFISQQIKWLAWMKFSINVWVAKAVNGYIFLVWTYPTFTLYDNIGSIVSNLNKDHWQIKFISSKKIVLFLVPRIVSLHLRDLFKIINVFLSNCLFYNLISVRVRQRSKVNNYFKFVFGLKYSVLDSRSVCYLVSCFIGCISSAMPCSFILA